MNWLDLLIVVFTIVGLVKGLFDGFVKQVVSLVAFILAILFAGALAEPIRNVLVCFGFIYNNVSPTVLNILCYIIAFLILLMIFGWLGKVIQRFVKFTPISFLDKILGGIAGTFLAIVLLSLCFNLLSILDKNSKLVSKQTKKESVLYYKVEGIVPYICPFVRNF